MPRTQLPLDLLPAWLALNDGALHDVSVSQTDGKGFGLVASRDLSSAGGATPGAPALLTVPHGLVLNAEAVEEHAKEDSSFRLLLDAAGRQSTRGDILLFLLVQASHSSGPRKNSAGVPNGWTEYVKFLPESVPVPTLWTEEERALLRGTSLEPAVNAKMLALAHEFDSIREKSSAIQCWEETLWESNDIRLTSWLLLDAWYRSRCLELPRSGESMVPCLDMANHSSKANAYYEENPRDEVVLLLRPQSSVGKGDEVTINYGAGKSPAEMLFSYGFIDPASTSEGLTLPLEPFPDDPLGKAKLHVFGGPATVTVRRAEDGEVQWGSPFAYIMCVNEEDGIEFRVLQETDGSRRLRMFWQDADVTGSAGSFEQLIDDHPLRAIIRLRVVTVVQERLQGQLERIRAAPVADPPSDSALAPIRPGCLEAALLLRQMEATTLEGAVTTLEEQRLQLLSDESVLAYLGSMEPARNDLAGDEEAPNEEVDFS